jgi:hypothetical protein
MRINEVYRNSGLGKWFHDESANKTPGWDRYNSEGKLVGECGDANKGEAYSACLSKQKADKLGKEGRASFVRRKRAAQNKAGRGEKGSGGKGKKPINVDTGASKMEECYECEQDLILEGKNKPNDPEKWSACKSAAKSKFDVYPSAYANAWAAKCYKKKGGTWRSVNEEVNLKNIIKENILSNFMENVKPEFARRGAGKQRPKSWGKGVKSGSEKRKMREEGKQEARQVNEAVSIFSPAKKEETKQTAPAPKQPIVKQDKSHEKISGIPESPSYHSAQLKVFRSLLPAQHSPNVELTTQNNMGGASPLNTANTPKIDFSDTIQQISSVTRERDALRTKLSDIEQKQADTKMRRAITRELNRRKQKEAEESSQGTFWPGS